MKKLLVAFCVLGVTVCAFGQGQVISQNSSATAVTNRVTGARAAVATVAGFYANPNAAATATSPGWVLAGGTANFAAPGLFVGGTRDYAGFPAGTAASFQVRAWLTTGSFANYEAAFAAEGLTGGAFGQSVVMRITPTAAPTPPPTFLGSGLTAFTIDAVPEPSSIALGLLGLGAIALFRRRK